MIHGTIVMSNDLLFVKLFHRFVSPSLPSEQQEEIGSNAERMKEYWIKEHVLEQAVAKIVRMTLSSKPSESTLTSLIQFLKYCSVQDLRPIISALVSGQAHRRNAPLTFSIVAGQCQLTGG